MIDYTAQFATLCVLHLVAVASPGPDFAVVVKQSVSYGRRTAVWTSIGVGTGILVHTAYSLLGFGLLVKSSLTAFTVMKFAAAGYLAWIGLKGLRSRPRQAAAPAPGPAATPKVAVSGDGESAPPAKSKAGESDLTTALVGSPTPTTRSAFLVGFMTNALNPKATLFFLSVFSVIIDPLTPRLIVAGYGLWMSIMTAVWFCLVSVFFTHERVRQQFLQLGHWFDRVMGVILLALAVRLAFASL
jgi:threonine/homoserine/homoserine lactone efflux protein